MALAPFTVTALAESDAQGTSGKNIVSGAVITLNDINGAVANIYDDSAGSNPSTAKTTNTNGQRVIYAESGEYTLTVNGDTSRVIIGADKGTTAFLISSQRQYQVGDVVETTGYSAPGDGGSAQWKKTGDTGVASKDPATRGDGTLTDANGDVWELVANIVTPIMLGADPSGVSDSSGAFNAASATGLDLYVPEGNYRVDSQWLLAGGASYSLHKKAALTFDSSIDIAITTTGGSLGSSSSMTSDVNKGDLTVEVADGSLFNEGQWVLVADEGSRTTNQPRNGEAHRIESISTNTITLRGALLDSYTTAAGGFLQVMNLIPRVDIEGGRYVGSGSGNSLSVGIDLQFCEGCSVTNTFVDNFYNRGINIGNSINFLVKSNQIERCLNPTTGYAILNTAVSQWGTIENNIAINCGKVWDQGGLSSEYGLTRFVSVTKNKGYSCLRGGVSTHETCEYIDILFNQLYDCGLNATNAILTRNGNIRIEGNTIRGTGLGGIVASNRGQAGYAIVRSNEVYLDERSSGSPGGGIYVYNQDHLSDSGTLSGSFSRVEIDRNTVEIDNAGIISIGFEQRLSSSMRNLSVKGNNVRALGAANNRGILLYANGGNIFGGSFSSNEVWAEGDFTIKFLAEDGNINEFAVTANHTVGADDGLIQDGASSLSNRSIVTGNVIRGNVTEISGFDNVPAGTNVEVI